MSLAFVHLNFGWNADPNVPDPEANVEGVDVILRFVMNPFQFPDFHEEEQGFLRFVNCAQFRMGPTNDEGWYLGQCRFSGKAPEWGEFYAVLGEPHSADGPNDWVLIEGYSDTKRTHFLFYFRDETFECLAERCLLEPIQNNALIRTSKSLPNI